jgi:hypothetical protein
MRSNVLTGIQKRFCYTQANYGSLNEVFPLLCPVREKDWIDGWEYEMIYSESGFAEKDCVFSTPYRDNIKTIWQITQYDPINYMIEFVRFTPNENIVKININLESDGANRTKSNISYQYTVLNQNQNSNIEEKLFKKFNSDMKYWENAINHYLETGKILNK